MLKKFSFLEWVDPSISKLINYDQMTYEYCWFIQEKNFLSESNN